MATTMVSVQVNEHVYREIALWTEWAKTTPDALVDWLLREWLAGQERTLGNDEQADEWLTEATREETPKCSVTGCDAPAVVWKSSSAANASAFCAEHDRQVRAELAEATRDRERERRMTARAILGYYADGEPME